MAYEIFKHGRYKNTKGLSEANETYLRRSGSLVFPKDINLSKEYCEIFIDHDNSKIALNFIYQKTMHSRKILDEGNRSSVSLIKPVKELGYQMPSVSTVVESEIKDDMLEIDVGKSLRKHEAVCDSK